MRPPPASCSYFSQSSLVRMRPRFYWGPARKRPDACVRLPKLGAGTARLAVRARAIQKLVELEVEAGRFAAAEQLVQRAMDDPRNDATELPLFLGPIYWLQGRIVDAEQSIEARWRVLNGRGAALLKKPSIWFASISN